MKIAGVMADFFYFLEDGLKWLSCSLYIETFEISFSNITQGQSKWRGREGDGAGLGKQLSACKGVKNTEQDEAHIGYQSQHDEFCLRTWQQV